MVVLTNVRIDAAAPQSDAEGYTLLLYAEFPLFCMVFPPPENGIPALTS